MWTANSRVRFLVETMPVKKIDKKDEERDYTEYVIFDNTIFTMIYMQAIPLYE